MFKWTDDNKQTPKIFERYKKKNIACLKCQRELKEEKKLRPKIVIEFPATFCRAKYTKVNFLEMKI